MKGILNPIVGFLLLCSTSLVFGGTGTIIQPPKATGYTIIAQDANSRVWGRTDYELDPSGAVVPRKHSYTELASGLNHQVNGQWVESSEKIEILPNGTAAATDGQHQAYFPGDIYQGQIELVTPDGQHLQSRPLALSYFDGTDTVMIAELTNSIGIVVGNNQVVYPNAFTDIKADLRYTYTKAGFEQDIILRQQPPTPESLGLNPDTARLQIMTEFYSARQPTIRSTRLPTQAHTSLEDESLDFGAMRMVQGRAFLMGQERDTQRSGALVSKHWVIVNGRQVLIEEVPVDAILDGLAALPLTAMNSSSKKNSHMASRQLTLPPKRLVVQNASKNMMLAKADLPLQGFVLDYQTVSASSTNFTFQGDTTYYISGQFNSYGTNTFEGGTVIKYATNGTIYITPGPPGTTPGINSKGSSYRPSVFTAIDDNSVGESITGSTGNPTGHYYGNPMLLLVLSSPVPTMTGIRMTYANTGFQFSGANINIYGAQFVNCQYGFGGVGANVNLRNALFASTKTNFFFNTSVSVNAQNVTFSGSSCLLATPSSPQGCSLTLSNCIFANITNLSVGSATPGGSYNGFYIASKFGSATTTNIFYPFQIVAGGDYYLASGCAFMNAGTINIDSTLLASLRQKTINPPISFTNVTFSAVTNFSPYAARDTNASYVALGYHYDPLDYAFGGCTASSNLTFNAGTAVGWFRTTSGWYHAGQGIQMSGNITVSFAGTVTSPTYWVRLNTVQEQDLTAGYGHGGIENWAGPSVPVVLGNFLRCSAMAAEQFNGFFSDDYGLIQAEMTDSEFWNGNLQTYGDYMTYTNCLLQRVYVALWNGQTTGALFLQNCTLYGGEFVLSRNSAGPTPVAVRGSAFDGTSISTGDYYGGNPTYTSYDYNAYTNLTDPFSIGGAHDVVMTNGFNWQTSWFGNYYQATNSLLINKGYPTADLVGLYHFTTQTNQTVEGTSYVDIGYHYVATDQYGNPLDTNGNGIPDYLEDANGDGIYDGGDLGDWQSFFNLKVLITKPRNGGSLP